MSSTRIWRWMVLPATAVAMLTIGTQHGRPQAPPPPVPDLKLDIPQPPRPVAPPPTPSVDALLDQLEQVRKQKAALDAREKALLSQLAERLKGLQERMSKLGVAPAVPPDVKFVDEKFPSLPDTKDPKVPPPLK